METTQQPEQSSSSEFLTATDTSDKFTAMERGLCIIGTVGILDNGLVIWVLVSRRSRFLNRNCYRFILHQSIIDLIASIFLILTTVFHKMRGLPPGLVSEVNCRVWLTRLFLWGPLMASTYNLCAMSIERYFAVLKPIAYKSASKQVIFTSAVISVWVIGMVYNALMKIITAQVEDGSCKILHNWSSLEARKGFGILTIVLEFIFPILLLIYCYGHIYFALRRMNAAVGPIAQSEQDKAANNRLKASRKIIKTLLWVSICFALCWAWNQTYFLLMNLGFDLSTKTNFYKITVIAGFLNSCVNPFVYLIKDSAFRKEARSLVTGSRTSSVVSDVQ